MSWKEDFGKVVAKTHTEQAIWWLNGFWADGASDYAEEIWSLTHLFLEVQLDRPVLYGRKTQQYDEDADLDEMKSHIVLEKLGNTMTAMALRKALKELDIDQNHRMAITEYLLNKYTKTPQQVVDAPQGDVAPEKLAAAQKACDDAAEAFANAQEEAKAAAKALAASIAAAAEADTANKAAEEALALSEAATAKVKAAEAELQAAIDSITALEEAKAAKIAKSKAIIDDDSMSVVKKGRAKQEMEALLSEDELPLRKAKITQGAALKKVTKARVHAEAEEAKAKAAAEAAAAAKQAADDAATAADAAKKSAEEAEVVAAAAMKEALDQLEELKKGGGTPNGKIWWMERVLAEKKRFMK